MMRSSWRCCWGDFHKSGTWRLSLTFELIGEESLLICFRIFLSFRNLDRRV
ncbi:hypothetical protein Taro_048683 [Colocasia esculenta]|uniref:Uncharacterized protein n=1 Tax=Colocasia esculenta TaxID=4460 RepID=A0A843X8R6_COLES|nr:hypothetical protein [Colocasia esculenta]